MKKLEEDQGYKTLKSSYIESLSNEKSVSETGGERNEVQPYSSIVNTVNESEKVEVTKLKRDIVTLQAEMKARSDKIEQNGGKLKILRSNIMKRVCPREGFLTPHPPPPTPP